MEQPEKVDFVLNLATAKTLGLTFPPALLAQATRTIEVPAEVQAGAKVYKIGVLSYEARSDSRNDRVFVEALRGRGYEIGRNLAVESRFAAGKQELLPDLAADLIRRKVDVILTGGSSETLAAVKATATIPIVFITPAPVELGIVRSLARPGGNATGFSVEAGPEVAGKLLELLKQIVPRLSRVSILQDPDRPDLRVYQSALNEASRVLRLETRLVGVRGTDDLDAALATIAAERPGALGLGTHPVISFHRKRIAEFATKRSEERRVGKECRL